MKRLLALACVLPLASVPAARATTAPTCYGLPATIVATGDVHGTPGDDVIVATAVSTVHAGAGDDRVCGAEVVHGGPGDDQIRFARHGGYDDRDGRLYGGPGDDRLEWLAPRWGYLVGGGGADTLFSRRHVQALYGGPGPDHLTSGRGRDWLVGNGGGDVLRSGPATDHLLGGRGRDRLHAGTGTYDFLSGGPGRDRGDGGPGKDQCWKVERVRSCHALREQPAWARAGT